MYGPVVSQILDIFHKVIPYNREPSPDFPYSRKAQGEGNLTV
jgi:hypothetical protein